MLTQELLDRKPPLVWVVVDEAVLRRPIGPTKVMVGQIDRLLTLACKPHIQLQVLAFAKGVHAAMDGAFTTLDMSDGEHLAYAEVPGSGRVITDSDEVEKCNLRFGALRSLALSPDESIDFMSRYKEAHSNGIGPF